MLAENTSTRAVGERSDEEVIVWIQFVASAVVRSVEEERLITRGFVPLCRLIGTVGIINPEVVLNLRVVKGGEAVHDISDDDVMVDKR